MSPWQAGTVGERMKCQPQRYSLGTRGSGVPRWNHPPGTWNMQRKRFESIGLRIITLFIKLQRYDLSKLKG